MRVTNVIWIVTWVTYYQIKDVRTEKDILIQAIFQKIYLSIGDFLTTLAFLYFFYK